MPACRSSRSRSITPTGPSSSAHCSMPAPTWAQPCSACASGTRRSRASIATSEILCVPAHRENALQPRHESVLRTIQPGGTTYGRRIISSQILLCYRGYPDQHAVIRTAYGKSAAHRRRSLEELRLRNDFACRHVDQPDFHDHGRTSLKRPRPETSVDAYKLQLTDIGLDAQYAPTCAG